MKRRHVEQVLRDAGVQHPPAPRPEFVRQVETQFGTTRVVSAPRPRRRAPWAIAGATAAALLAAGVLLASNDHDDQGVTTLPTLATTTTTEETTTTVPVIVTTSTTAPTGTTVPPATTTSTTSTTTVPETTTSTVPPVQDLGMHCSTNASTSAVVCEWSASTSHDFDHFRVWKHTGDGPDQELYTGTATRYEDHELNGARMYYEVTALSTDGRVLGHGVMFVICC